MDESRYRLSTIFGRLWAPRGSKPLCFTNGLTSKVNVFGSLDEEGKFIHMFSDIQNSEIFIEFLQKLLIEYSKILLVTDNAPWHRSKRTKEFIEKNDERIEIVFLPPYSPEMNPAEECWRRTRMNVTTNRYFDTKQEMENTLSEFFNNHIFNINLLNYLGL